MLEKKRRLSPSEIKREKRKDKYFDLFPEKKPVDLKPHEAMMELKRKNRMCQKCDPVDLILGIGDRWMCWDCEHNTLKGKHD